MNDVKRNRQGCLVTKTWNVLKSTQFEDIGVTVELAETDYGHAVRVITPSAVGDQYSITQFPRDTIDDSVAAATPVYTKAVDNFS